MVVKASISFLTANSNPVLVTNVSTILTSLDGSLNYETPVPALTVIRAAVDAFIAAIAAAADGGKQLTWAKKTKRADLVVLMRQLASYVQMECAGDMTKLLSSGFPVQKPNRTPAQVPPTPVAPKVKHRLTGEAIATTNKAANAYIYNWQVMLADDPATVVARGQSTGARASFTGLIPGKSYLFKANAVGTAGASDWSDAGSLMVI